VHVPGALFRGERRITCLPVACIYQVNMMFWHMCKLGLWVFTCWTYRCVFRGHFCKC